eukprot:TRINITY_DN4610_c0_g1_i2.p1 TRINITY_DN4610_c0_g1~~TRINITY_DN4610_c0_g1_i2.p1  ORF type:complete len:252 (-),score=68.05 TRINITY_DN4610_c0_g1_i2:724-1479(-)
MGDSEARTWLWFVNSVIKYKSLRDYFQERIQINYEEFARHMKSNCKLPQWGSESLLKKLYFWYKCTLPSSLPFKYIVTESEEGIATLKLKQPDLPKWNTKLWGVLLPISFEPELKDLQLCKFCILDNNRKAVMAGPLALIRHNNNGPFIYDNMNDKAPNDESQSLFGNKAMFVSLVEDASLKKIGMEIEAIPSSWVLTSSAFGIAETAAKVVLPTSNSSQESPAISPSSLKIEAKSEVTTNSNNNVQNPLN